MKANKQKRTQSNPAQQSSTATLHAAPNAHPKGYTFFPTAAERILFRRPWLTILATGAMVLLINQRFDLPFIATAIVLSISAALFNHWLSLLPKTLALVQSRSTPSNTAVIEERINSFTLGLAGRHRFILPAIALAITCVFLKFFLSENITHGPLLAWAAGTGIWAWMLGAAGFIMLSIANLFHSLGKHDAIRILPEHQDQCGGLEPIGTFFIWMTAPLILISTFLTLAAFDPKLPPDQHYAMGHPFSPPSPRVSRDLNEANMRIARSMLLKEIGAKRIERLKKKCTDLESAPSDAEYRACIGSIESELAEINLHNKPSRASIWASPVRQFSVLGMAILIPISIACLIWPLAGLHASMVKERDARELRHSIFLESLTQQTQEKIDKGETADVATSAARIAELKRQMIPVSRYPTWPFKASALRNLAIPQLTSLSALAAKTIIDLFY
ncbi:hypothetical protein [Corallococcus sp. AS-1-12]|uniref:hypothetical protein n=1 Tax=Corallococcus sp. AS-1-12 TaxID=2874598 RepID=UPI001CBF85E0|nr:hypothetical protein [Corallococcus sp. AS-1-12]MBZ4336677.1 hypothetical protein [Corallococcus sp. AS-1-12]